MVHGGLDQAGSWSVTKCICLKSRNNLCQIDKYICQKCKAILKAGEDGAKSGARRSRSRRQLVSPSLAVSPSGEGKPQGGGSIQAGNLRNHLRKHSGESSRRPKASRKVRGGDCILR